jgi:hypothetical protein
MTTGSASRACSPPAACAATCPNALLDAKPQVKALAEMVNEDTLVTAAEKYSGYRKYVPAFLETFEFKATGSKNPVLASVKVLRDLNRADSARCRPTRRCRSDPSNGRSLSSKMASQIGGSTRPPCLPRCAIGCGRAMSPLLC